MSNGRVMFFHNWSHGVFQKKMIAGLKDVGVEVYAPDYSGPIFPLSRAIRNSETRILHLHWVQDLIASNEPNFLRACIRYCLFYFDLLILRFVLKVPIIWTVHNLQSHEMNWPGLDIMGRRMLAKRSKQITVMGNYAVSTVAATYGIPTSKISVIHHGNFSGVLPKFGKQNEIKQELGYQPEESIFLFFGNVRPYKGVEDLIKAFENLDEPNSHLIVAGRPVKMNAEYITNLTKDERIHFDLRFIPNDLLAKYINAADVLVFPYKNILTSGSIILAISQGKIFVAPDLGTIADYYRPGGGVLYQSNDPGALEKALKKAMHLDKEKAKVVNLALAKELSWESISKAYKALYQNLLK